MPLKLYFMRLPDEAMLIVAHDADECINIAVQDTGDYRWMTTQVIQRLLVSNEVTPTVDRGQPRVLVHAHSAEDWFNFSLG